MENPDVELEVKRDESGKVTGVAYKVNTPGEDNRRPLEFGGMLEPVFAADGPEDHSVVADVDVHLGS